MIRIIDATDSYLFVTIPPNLILLAKNGENTEKNLDFAAINSEIWKILPFQSLP